MNTEASSDLLVRPRSILQKEQELSEMLDHVLQVPLAPLRQGLSDVGLKADGVQQKLHETMKVLQLNGDDLESIKTRVKAIQGLVVKLEELETGLCHAFAATATAASLTSMAEASSHRDQGLIDTLGELREETRRARLDAGRRWRWAMTFLAATLVVSSVDLIARFLMHMN